MYCDIRSEIRLRAECEDDMLNSRNRTGSDAEPALIEQASGGNLEAFNQLVLNHQDLAYSHAYTLLGDRPLSEDVVQESFIKAFQNMPGFRGGSFRAWLLKIVTNTAYDLLRRSGRHPTRPLFPEDEDGDEMESPAWLADPSASVEAAIERKQERQRIEQVLQELPESYRSAVTLVDIDELDYLEAAQALNIPLGTLKSRLARARLRIAEALRQGTDYSEQSGRRPANAIM